MSAVSTRRLAQTALFAAITAVLAQIALPMPALVPLSLGTVGGYLAAGLLSPRQATESQLVYLLAGGVGIPVFAGFQGGLGVFMGPTGGFLLGYLFSAGVAACCLARWGRTLPRLIFSLAVGTLCCYLIGMLWYQVITDSTLPAAFIGCVLPFLPGDGVKILLSALIIRRLTPLLSPRS